MTTNGAVINANDILPFTAREMADVARDNPASQFRFYSVEEMRNLPPLSWQVEHIIPAQSFAVIYGQPETGKSFVALALAFAVATGRPFFDRPVKRGPVIYVASEGSNGMSQRITAWLVQERCPQCPSLWFLRDAVNMGDLQSVTAFASAIQRLPEPPELIVLDTLARSLLGGDENSAQDMGILVEHSDKLRKMLKTTMLFIHHTGKNGESERGSTALRGAADVMIKVEREKEGRVITLVCEKQKDAPHFPNIITELVEVEAANSCALITPRTAVGVTLLLPGSQPHRILESLQRHSLEDGLTNTQWLAVSGFPDSTFYLHRKTLVTLGYVARTGTGRGARYVLTPEGEALIATNSNIAPKVAP